MTFFEIIVVVLLLLILGVTVMIALWWALEKRLSLERKGKGWKYDDLDDLETVMFLLGRYVKEREIADHFLERSRDALAKLRNGGKE